MADQIAVERAGRNLAVSSEFRVTYPDGHAGTLWSPPWHELSDAGEHEAARTKAAELFAAGRHRTVGPVGQVRKGGD